MATNFLFVGLLLTILLAPSYAKPSPSSFQLATRPIQGQSAADTRAVIARGLQAATLSSRDAKYKAEDQLNFNMDDVTLFKIGGSMKGPTHGNVNKTGSSTTEVAGSIEIKCKKCYLTTLAMAEIEVQSDSDNDTFSDILNDTVNNVIDRVNETVTETFDAFDAYFSNYHNWDDYADGVTENILEDGFDLTDLLPPNINVSSFDNELDLAIPATTITFRFEDLDLYLELETKLKASATYTLKLMPPGANPVGIELPNNIKFGVIFSVDLILAIDGELDITGGLHVKVDDHVAMRLELFGDKVSDMSL